MPLPEDYSDVYSRKRVWTGPNSAIKPRVPSNLPANFTPTNLAYATQQSSSPRLQNTQVSPSLSNSPSVRPSSANASHSIGNRVFRKPTGGSFNISFDPSSPSSLQYGGHIGNGSNIGNPPTGAVAAFHTPFSTNQQVTPSPPAHAPFPGTYVRNGSVITRSSTRLKDSSFIALSDDEDSEPARERKPSFLSPSKNHISGSLLPANSARNSRPSSASFSPKLIDEKPEPASSSIETQNTSRITTKLGSLGSSSKTLVNLKADDRNDAIEFETNKFVNSFKGIKASLNQDIEDHSHSPWKGKEQRGHLFEAIPKFLTVIVPSIMTHHTAIIDPDSLVTTSGYLNKMLTLPILLISLVGISWTSVSSFNTDTAASTAFVVFIAVTRVIAFVRYISGAIFERRAKVKEVVAPLVLRRAAILVWVPSTFMFLPLFYAQHWMGWRDCMWAAGGVLEVLAVLILNTIESPKRHTTLRLKHQIQSTNYEEEDEAVEEMEESSEGIVVVVNEKWDSDVRLRTSRLVTLVIVATACTAVFSYRPGVDFLDSIVTMQFALGPFILSCFGFIGFYCAHWLYEIMQKQNSIICDWNLRIKQFFKKQELRKDRSPVLNFVNPPLAIYWRLAHVGLLASVLLIGASFQTILQDLVNQWLGLAGFNPKIPMNIDADGIFSLSNGSLVDTYINLTAAADITFSGDQYFSLNSIWDFSTPRVWCSLGVAMFLLFCNVCGLLASLSFLRITIRDSSIAMESARKKQSERRQLNDEKTAELVSAILNNYTSANNATTHNSTSYEDDPLPGQFNRFSSNRRANAPKTPSLISHGDRLGDFAGNISKTQSMVNFHATTNNSKASKYSFAPHYRQRTPTPSLVTIKSGAKQFGSNETNSQPAGSGLLVLENDHQFWQDLLDSPTATRFSSVGKSKSIEAVNNIVGTSTLDEFGNLKNTSGRDGNPAGNKHVSIFLEEAVKPIHRRLWTGASTTASVSEEKPLPIHNAHMASSVVAKSTNHADSKRLSASSTDDHVRTDTGINWTVFEASIRAVRKTLILKFILRLLVPCCIFALVPLARLGGRQLAPLIGNLGNDIDMFTPSDSVEASGANMVGSADTLLDGSRPVMVENAESVIVMCGSTLIMLIASLIEEAKIK